MDEEMVRDQMMKELEEEEWDMSDNALTRVATRLSHYFKSDRESKDFVEENASYLYSIMEDMAEDDAI